MMDCKETENRLSLYLYDEVSGDERSALEAHLDACARCQAALEEGRKLHHVLSERRRREPSPELLVECRQALEEALDREQLGWRGVVRNWLMPFPAVGAAAVLTLALFAFSLGWTLRPRVESAAPDARTPVSSSFLGANLNDLRIRGITQVVPGPSSGAVRVTLDAERRVTLEGSLDDPGIRQVLVYAVKSYDNPGIRRDTLDVLRSRSDNPAVREALLYAMRQDANAGVRLEALNAVRRMPCTDEVHPALLEVLERDANPGVRLAAINALIAHMGEEGRDETVERALRRLSANEPNRSLRLKCLTAVQELGDHEE